MRLLAQVVVEFSDLLVEVGNLNQQQRAQLPNRVGSLESESSTASANRST